MANNFGELILVLGDVHIPDRACKIAEPFQRMLVPNKMSHVCITGNVGSYYAELQKLAPNIHVTRGDYDDAPYPETAVVQVGQFKIGLYHGHQRRLLQPDRLQRKLQVDVLITGNTNESSVQERDGYFHINPGSITGADPLNSVTPSFILLAISDDKLSCYVYELINEQVEVSKTEYVLPDKSQHPALLDSLLH